MTQMVQGFSVLSPQGCRGKAGGGVIGPSLEVNWVQVGVVNKARLSPDLCGVFLQTNAGTQQCVCVCVWCREGGILAWESWVCHLGEWRSSQQGGQGSSDWGWRSCPSLPVGRGAGKSKAGAVGCGLLCPS